MPFPIPAAVVPIDQPLHVTINKNDDRRIPRCESCLHVLASFAHSIFGREILVTTALDAESTGNWSGIDRPTCFSGTADSTCRWACDAVPSDDCSGTRMPPQNLVGYSGN